MLCMVYISSAYVIVKTVDAGVSVSKGFYFRYADYSSIGNLVGVFELILILGWQFWGFVQPILATWLASDVWGQMEKRVAEANADTIGFDTPLSWEIAIKTNALLMLVGLILVISGFSLGDIADEAITWHGEYEDDTNSEAADKNDSSNKDSAGTSATYDIAMHMVTAIFGMFVFGIMSISSFIFAWDWLAVYDGNANFRCDLPRGDYSGLLPLFGQITDYDSCMTNVS